jgi:hypothetical protein
MIRSRSFKFVLLACLAILLSSLACTINFGNDTDDEISAEQTLVAIQLTQAALENQSPEEPVVPTEEPEPEEPEQVPDFVYEGISFSFDSSIALNVNAATIPAQDMGDDYMPGETYPTHYEFTFNTYAVGDHFHTAKIIVYPVDEYLAISPYVSEAIDGLKNALATHPTGGLHDSLPFLPMWPAAQIFNARVEYFDFQNGSGLRYLTMYGQALYPVDNQNLFYTYQGLTADGRYYICAVLPVIHMGLPNDGSSEVDDWEEFSNNFDTYITDTIAWLEAQDPNTFFPSLNVLDDMMASFEINR